MVKSRKLVTLRLLAGQMFFNFVENRITSGKERCDAKRVCTYANCARDYGGHESVINMAFNGSRSIYSGARSNNGTTGPVLMLINFKCISKITTPRRGELGNINVINRRQNRDLKAPMERWYHCGALLVSVKCVRPKFYGNSRFKAIVLFALTQIYW